jgi:hypothetical protein
MPRNVGVILACFLPGCAVLDSPEKVYVSNRPLLEEIPRLSGYSVDPAKFRLVGTDVREDSITYQFQGVEYAGDHAWVVRFSEKSTEQLPDALTDVVALLPLIAESRMGFELIEEGTREVGGSMARFARYRFDSPVNDAEGKPFPGHGIVAALRVDSSGGPIVYQMKLDNHGDRDDVRWEDLGPFEAPITGL